MAEADSIVNIAQQTGQGLQSMAQRSNPGGYGNGDFANYTDGIRAAAAFQQTAMPVIAATAQIFQRGQQIQQAEQSLQLQSMAERTRQQLAGLQMQDHQLGLDDARTLSEMQSAAFKLDPLSPTYDTDLTKTLAGYSLSTSQGNVGRLGLANTLMDNKAVLTAQATKAALDREKLTSKTNNDKLQAQFYDQVNKYNSGKTGDAIFHPEVAIISNPDGTTFFSAATAQQMFNEFKAKQTPIQIAPGLIPKETVITNADGSKTTYVNPEANKPKLDSTALNNSLRDIDFQIRDLRKQLNNTVTPEDQDKVQGQLNSLYEEKKGIADQLNLKYNPPIVPVKSTEDKAKITVLDAAIGALEGGEGETQTGLFFKSDIGANAKAVLPPDKLKQFTKEKTATGRRQILEDYKDQLNSKYKKGTKAAEEAAPAETEAPKQSFETQKETLVKQRNLPAEGGYKIGGIYKTGENAGSLYLGGPVNDPNSFAPFSFGK